MTIDEIVEEFDNKFCKDGFINLGNCAIYTTTQIENWLKQKLTEAKREAYLDCREILRNNSDPVVWEKIREKLDKLEAK